MLLTQLVSSITLAAVNPFLPLYLIELGETRERAIVWTGFMAAGIGVTQLIAIPIWGSVADRFGRKPMLVRALFGVAAVLSAYSAAQAAWHVLLIRVTQGAIGAPNAAILAMAGTVLPRARLGLGMGLLQTLQFVGESTGALVGAVAVTWLGFRGTFLAAAAATLVNLVLAQVFAHEPPRPLMDLRARRGFRAGVILGWQVRQWRVPIIGSIGYQAAYSLGWVLMPLQIASGRDPATVAGAVGWVVTANAIGVACGASIVGWLAGRVGSRRTSVLSLVGAACLTIPLVFSPDVVAFALWRLALAFCIGGVMPSFRASIGEAARTPEADANLAMIYGLSGSATAGAGAVAPLIASVLASSFGFGSVLVASAVILAITAGWCATDGFASRVVAPST